MSQSTSFSKHRTLRHFRLILVFLGVGTLAKPIVTLKSRGYLLLIGLCLESFGINAQINQRSTIPDTTISTVYIDLSGPSERRLMRRYDGRTFKAKSYTAEMTSMYNDFFASGYIAVNQEEQITGDTLTLMLHPGIQYEWEDLTVSDAAAGVLRKAGVNIDRFRRRWISPNRINRALEKGLKELENNGFPFAEFKIDSIEIHGPKVSGTILLEQGKFTLIDSVNIEGDLKVRESYLTSYLGIKEGKPYSEKALLQIPDRLQSIRFLSVVKPPEINFQDDKTKVTLFLNRNNASSFDGIVGFLPDNQTGKILITGDVKLHLENALKQGEVIDLNWRKLQTNTQELDASVVTPYVLNSPVSLDGGLTIYRRDTLFTDVFRQFGVRYVFGSDDYVRLFIDRQTTDLISTSQYENITTPPPYLDRAITSYGVGLQLINLDYRLNPAKGFELHTETGLGQKEIVINENIPEAVYDSLSLNSIQVKGELDVSYYLSFIPRLVWHQRMMGASLVNQQLFNNEAYRIGGLKSLRGFNEESIFATSYLILRSEIRYQFDRDGYVFGFFDGAWYENKSLNSIGASRDLPFGTGAGVSFSTKAGVFSLSYAVGSEQGNPLLLRAAKVHFGFLSLF